MMVMIIMVANPSHYILPFRHVWIRKHLFHNASYLCISSKPASLGAWQCHSIHLSFRAASLILFVINEVWCLDLRIKKGEEARGVHNNQLVSPFTYMFWGLVGDIDTQFRLFSASIPHRAAPTVIPRRQLHAKKEFTSWMYVRRMNDLHYIPFSKDLAVSAASRGVL